MAIQSIEPSAFNKASVDMEDRLRIENALFARFIRAFNVYSYRPWVQDGRICNLPDYVLECRYGIVYSEGDNNA